MAVSAAQPAAPGGLAARIRPPPGLAERAPFAARLQTAADLSAARFGLLAWLAPFAPAARSRRSGPRRRWPPPWPRRGHPADRDGGHDHWKPYFTMEGVEHGLCNAHHPREPQALMEIEGEGRARRKQQLLRRADRAVHIARGRQRAVPARLVRGSGASTTGSLPRR